MRREHVVLLEQAYLKAQRSINFTGRHRFDDRSRGADRLALVLAGYKPHLWDLTLPRLERFLPDDLDVCVISPGREVGELRTLAGRKGWSYLATRGNYPSLAANLAIRAHPRAEFVFKVDEDVFVAEGVLERLLGTYARVEEERRHWPGFVAPLLNVNGYSYLPFLQALGLESAYRERFGPLTQAAGPLPITEHPEAARWVWEHTLPFDETAARLAAGEPVHSAVPHKFSIGAILFHRDFWEQFGGFKVRPFVGGIGVDEAHICAAAMTFSKAMVVSHTTLAGHFSFAPQDAAMREALADLRPGLAIEPQAMAA